MDSAAASTGRNACERDFQMRKGDFRGLRHLTQLQLFECKYRVEKDGCWDWLFGITPNGYSVFRVGEETWYGHRWSYQHFVGPLMSGKTIDHLCRNRRCVNPNHLEQVSYGENLRRGVAARWSPLCPNGHRYPVAVNGYRKCKECKRIYDRNRR